MGGNEGLAEALADEEERGDWIDRIKTELYGKMSMCLEETQRRRGETDQQLQTTRLMIMARKRKGFRRIRGGTTRQVELKQLWILILINGYTSRNGHINISVTCSLIP